MCLAPRPCFEFELYREQDPVCDNFSKISVSSANFNCLLVEEEQFDTAEDRGSCHMLLDHILNITHFTDYTTSKLLIHSLTINKTFLFADFKN